MNISNLSIFKSFRLPLSLWYDPRSIAAAALLMAYNGKDIPFPTDSSTLWGQYIEENSNLLSGNGLKHSFFCYIHSVILSV
jgi:hypothetical protein